MSKLERRRCVVPWQKPVRVRVGDGIPDIIPDAQAALEALSYRWPVRDGAHYLEARKSCAAVLEGTQAAEDAREVFIAASIEANMLAR
jgi:hypothetical protein